MPYKQLFILLFCLGAFQAYSQVDHPSYRQINNDSVITYASSRYTSHSFLHNWLMGKNYRKSWQQEVTLPLFRLSATRLKIIELGGGMQTKSLKLEDEKGSQWSLRTIDKDVAGAFPEKLKKSFPQKMAQDHISSAMPYGAPVVGALAKAARVIAAQPTIYFVADDTAFGPYRSIFANTVCMLEERDPKFESTESTKKVLQQIQNNNSFVINQPLLLRARLLDMLVGDWDRHFDNWRWGVKDSAGLQSYYAIPRDRDWAFYYGGGLVPKIVRVAALRFLVNFSQKPKYLKSLNGKVHHLDKVFLNQMTAADWQHAVQEVQQLLSDDAIKNAVQKLPKAVYDLEGDRLFLKLKSRRDGLHNAALDYYKFLVKEVQIEGTNKEETFFIRPAKNGFLLQIYRRENEKEGQKIFERTFLRSETSRVIINGLGGDDRFEIDGEVSTKIKLKVNGGSGKNTYRLGGNIRTAVHDDSGANINAGD